MTGALKRTICTSAALASLGLAIGCSSNNNQAPASCGGSGQPCCTSGSACTTGLTCNNNTCQQVCGGTGQPCCNSGLACNAGLTCNNSTCQQQQVCGGTGQPCCSSGTACSAGLSCSNSTCQQVCGGSGQPCCTSGNACTSGLSCRSGTCNAVNVTDLATQATLLVKTNPKPTGIPGYVGYSQGSGFFFATDATTGYFVTANHVVGGGATVTVNINDPSGTFYKDAASNTIDFVANHLGTAECGDLAVLKVTKPSGVVFQPLDFYTGTVSTGLPVWAAGFPDTVAGTPMLTDGTISGRAVDLRANWAYAKGVTHSATLNPGSSGGPLVTHDTGQYVGVNFASQTGNIYYAITSTQQGPSLLDLLTQLKTGTDIVSIGIEPQVIFDNQNPPVPYGVYVASVKTGKIAAVAGIRQNDIITSLNGELLDYIDDPQTPTNYSMQHYCTTLTGNNPNPPDSTRVSFTVTRKAGYVCTGELNGPSTICERKCTRYPTRQTYCAGLGGTAADLVCTDNSDVPYACCEPGFPYTCPQAVNCYATKDNPDYRRECP